ncbi:unnamed protein product [Blepharisma stoltei]|uniref:Uncharacterized protein n=1 Tax=Blepharisma stoltei TaxID=1481888 RepID=A0AAU9IHE0_9CILI|nr:unnamed protein product [Blepharisma stoltei]
MQPYRKKPSNINFSDDFNLDKKALTPNPRINQFDEFPSALNLKPNLGSESSSKFLDVPNDLAALRRQSLDPSSFLSSPLLEGKAKDDGNTLKLPSNLNMSRRGSIDPRALLNLGAWNRPTEKKSDIEMILESRSSKREINAEKAKDPTPDQSPQNQNPPIDSPEPDYPYKKSLSAFGWGGVGKSIMNQTADTRLGYIFDQMAFSAKVKKFQQQQELKTVNEIDGLGLKKNTFELKIPADNPKRGFGKQDEHQETFKRSNSYKNGKPFRKIHVDSNDVLRFDKDEYKKYTQGELSDTSHFAKRIMIMIKKN